MGTVNVLNDTAYLSKTASSLLFSKLTTTGIVVTPATTQTTTTVTTTSGTTQSNIEALYSANILTNICALATVTPAAASTAEPQMVIIGAKAMVCFSTFSYGLSLFIVSFPC